MRKKILIGGVAALALAGCGGGSSSSSKATGQTISLTRAAYVSGSSAGSKVLMSMRESVPGVGQLNMSGHGSFSRPSRQGSMTMQMGLPASAAAQAGFGSLTIQTVILPGTLYMKLPPQLAAKVPGGKPWWEIKLSQVGKLAGIPGFSSLISGSSSLNNPGQYLEFLRATASGSVKNLGPATVRGVPTTHYRARVDLTKLASAVSAAARPGVKQLVAALQKRGAMPQGLPVEAWIDSSNLIRQVAMAYSQPLGNGQSADVALKLNYFDYGPQPKPSTPPKSQTVDLLSLLGGA